MDNKVLFFKAQDVVDLTPNFYCDLGDINTKLLLASFLGISEASIEYFNFDDDAIVSAKILVNYNFPTFSGGKQITFFLDTAGRNKVISFTIGTLRALYSKNSPTVNGGGLMNLKYLEYCILPNTVAFGDTVLNNLVFNLATITPKLKVITNTFNQTSNSGGVEGDLAFVTANGGAVIYDNDADYWLTEPDAPTSLIQESENGHSVIIGFVQPVGVMPIEHYEVYVNGIFNNKSELRFTNNKILVKNLADSTSANVTIISVNKIRRKSILSSPLVITTTTKTPYSALSGIISWYKTNDIFGVLVDSIGSNNGTTYNMQRAFGGFPNNFLKNIGNGHIKFPTVAMKSLSLWVYSDSTEYLASYLIDLRTNGVGYILGTGSNSMTKLYIDGVNRVIATNSVTRDKWTHVYIEIPTAYTGLVILNSRYTVPTSETPMFAMGDISTYNRALTVGEITTLASGVTL